MSDEKHEFVVRSVWTGNSDGDGVVQFGGNGTLDYGVPVSTGGKAGRSNPEEMLLASTVACYSITLALLIEKRRLSVTKIEVGASGTMVRQPDRTLKFTEIFLRPRIALSAPDAAQEKTLTDLAHKAELYCVISRALRGNVEIHVEPEIILG